MRNNSNKIMNNKIKCYSLVSKILFFLSVFRIFSLDNSIHFPNSDLFIQAIFFDKNKNFDDCHHLRIIVLFIVGWEKPY